ncbi:MFS transporter [Streptomyces sp. P38-E01]|uniref:MFS transporter n=1 Tax=Streptomyces tardus TaxID=2780544 RepID=A0A949JHA9_9ACTN|nr:MFS transporter [Streptomyces tardus]MBU7598888.1 MFS transporter [Streptomyces tardus]
MFSLTAPAPSPRITFRAVLSSPHVTRCLGGTLVGRLPNGMAPVAIVLWTVSADGDLAFAGLLAALYGLCSSLSQPAKGMLLDRLGQRAVHVPAGLLNSSLLVALPAGGLHNGTTAVLLVIAAGLCTPPLEAGLRALWPTLLADPRMRHAALALDTGSQGLLYIVGPLLAAALASVHSPQAALGATAVLGSVGTLIVASATPSRRWKATPVAVAAGFRRRLASVHLVGLFVALAGVGFAIGALNVLAVALAEQHQMSLLSGIVPAAYSSGSIVGGLLYGRRVWPGRPSRHLCLGAATFLLGWLPLVAAPGPHTTIVAVIVPGACLTVVVACSYVVAADLAPAGRTSEAYAWLILSIGVGQSAGAAITGHLADHPQATALPAAGAALAFTVLATVRPGRQAPRRGRHRRTRRSRGCCSRPTDR